MIEFSEKDRKQLADSEISRNKVLDQIETFKTGIPFVQLEKAAVVPDGILRFSEKEEKEFIDYFDRSRQNESLLKFVPASGAASRMFKALFGFLEDYDPSMESVESFTARNSNSEVAKFFSEIKNLPFFEIVHNRIKGKAASKDREYYLFVEEMLSEDKLNYGFYPKGLLPFHNYGDSTATPFEEHLKEAALYAENDGEANLHFTISEQHGEMFNEEFNNVKERVSSSAKTSFHVGYSYQKSSTDTIAVTLDNKPFRNADGSLLLRPGGHGALIENLDEQDADIIFIKNIDNVVVPEFADKVANSKKVLAGLLLKIQSKSFEYARLLEGESIAAEQLHEIKSFLESDLNVRFSDKFQGFNIAQQINILKDKVNRPIRICGMVKNEGEPGGGPFWIKDGKGNVSLQIVESAQVNMSNEEQVSIFSNSTHFNPVDIVCGVKNHEGEKYNLMNFVDTKQGFITQKTKEGQELKALELPGLWNGAMAFWNTIFVEVPLITFNPVKTVNDLLKPAHQIK